MVVEAKDVVDVFVNKCFMYFFKKVYMWANFVKKIHKIERKYFLGKCYMYFHGEEKTR